MSELFHDMLMVSGGAIIALLGVLVGILATTVLSIKKSS